MTSQGSGVPLWAERYLPDFDALLRIVERAERFFLQPVEMPSPDLGRVFAGWLRGRGWQVLAVDLAEDGDWGRLADVLQASVEAGERRAVVVIAPYALDRAPMGLAMARVNMQRDSIARALGCPLLWCGTPMFARLTWELAPDFWSIASTPYRIPMRDGQEARRKDPKTDLWWTGAAAEDVTRLEVMFSRIGAEASDDAAYATLGLRLAECQLARGDREAAAQVLAAILPRVPIDLSLRWRLLHGAAQRAETGSHGVIDLLRRQIGEAEARGSKHTEAQLRLELANHLHFGRGPEGQSQARDELYRARTLLAEVGDALAALLVDETLTNSDQPPPPELIQEMVDNAERLLGESEDDETLYVVELVLSQLYLWQERFRDAERVLDSALARRRGGDAHSLRYVSMLHRRWTLASLAEDWPLACELASTMLALAKTGKLASLEIAQRFQRGGIYVRMGKPVHGGADFLKGVKVAVDLDDHQAAFGGLDTAALLALNLGLPDVGAVLRLRAAREFLRLLSANAARSAEFDTTWDEEGGEREIGEQIDALRRWAAATKPTLTGDEVQRRLTELARGFQQQIDVREAKLREQGIEAMDPWTWGISEEPPHALRDR